MLNRSPSAPVMGESPTPAAATTATMQPAAAGIPQPGPSQPMTAAPMMPGVSQGPLAFLEQTTSNIGSLPRGMSGSWNIDTVDVLSCVSFVVTVATNCFVVTILMKRWILNREKLVIMAFVWNVCLVSWISTVLSSSDARCLFTTWA